MKLGDYASPLDLLHTFKVNTYIRAGNEVMIGSYQEVLNDDLVVIKYIEQNNIQINKHVCIQVCGLC